MKKHIAVLVMALLTTALLCSCTKQPAEPSPTPEPSPVSTPEDTPAMTTETPTPDSGELSVTSVLTFSERLNLIGNIDLYAEASYPQTGIDGIDSYYSDALESFKVSAKDLSDNLRDYDDIESAVSEYMIDDSFEVVYATDNVFSVHRTVYSYTGGAHGNHGDVCDNFQISTGKRLTLGDLFDASEDEYMEDILAVFDAFIDADEAGGGEYGFFASAKDTLRDIFPSAQFCITETGLDFYLSPYFVTPYTSGTVIVPVSWDDINAPKAVLN